jgi:CHRD domain
MLAAGSRRHPLERSDMTRRRLQLAAALVFVLGLAGASIALASGSDNGNGKNGKGNFRASLNGLQETPAVITNGRGKLELSMTSSQITFKLDYSGLSGPPLFAHIHVGQRNVAGAVSVFFCGGGGKPACPSSSSGSVSGTIVAADVLGPPMQGVAAGDLASLEKAIKLGVAYANMHTTQSPAGEIRGQITRNHGHGKGHH